MREGRVFHVRECACVQACVRDSRRATVREAREEAAGRWWPACDETVKNKLGSIGRKSGCSSSLGPPASNVTVALLHLFHTAHREQER